MKYITLMGINSVDFFKKIEYNSIVQKGKPFDGRI